MTDELCQNCAWWKAFGIRFASVRAERDPQMIDGLGTCHLFPPTVIQISPGWVESVWPQTRESDACSEWAPSAPEINPGGGERVVLPFERPAA